MAQKLRLRSQKTPLKEEFNFAVEVLVDTNIPHLSDPYTYAVSTKYSDIEIGTMVSVPFGSRMLSGIVVSKSQRSSEGLKFIKKVLHSFPILNAGQIELIDNATERWVGSFWDFMRFAVPTIASSSNQSINFSEALARKVSQPELKIGGSYEDLISLIESRINPARQLLIVVPKLSDIDYLREVLKTKFIEYGSHLTSKERAENYLRILSGEVNTIVGTRSAIFLPLKADAEILVVDDLSFSFYESRHPFWNVRDVALLRSTRHSLTFYTHSPSLELLRLSESGWLRLSQKKNSRPQKYFLDGRIAYQSIVKNGLLKGAVLILVPDKGYLNAIVCGKCRNIYRCNCGGRLIQQDKSSKLTCNLCAREEIVKNCSYCKSDTKLGYRKGISKVIEELGKQFPGAIITKSGEERLTPKRNQIIIATYESYQIAKYSAVVALEFDRFAYQHRLRSSELGRKLVFDLLALNSESNYFDVQQTSYFGQVAALGNPIPSASAELKERDSAKLPPFYRVAVIDCDAKSASIFEEQNFFTSVDYGNGKAFLKYKVEEGARAVGFLTDLVRYRSLRKLKAWSVKVDPLDI